MNTSIAETTAKALLYIGFLLLIPLQMVEAATTTWKIMCIGDSITQGVYNKPGQPSKVDSYRYELSRKLAAGGFLVDFIGRRNFPSGGTVPGEYLHGSGWDHVSEGWAGRTTLDLIDPAGTHPTDGTQKRFNIFPDVNSIKTKGIPDIALIHIGTNDNNRSSLSGNDPVTGIPNKTLYTLNNALRNISILINDRLRPANPRIKIFLAQIIPTASSSLNTGSGCIGIQNFNAALVGFAHANSTASSPIYLVDQYTGYNSSNNFDYFHPTPAGDAVIAEKWYNAMRPVLSGTGIIPPPDLTDNLAPSVPGGLSASVISSSSIRLNWTASTDNIGVSGYEVYRNGIKLSALVPTNTFLDTGLQANTSYGYYVKAKDAFGNVSTASTSIITKTLSATMKFIKGINLNGPAVTLSGNAWSAYSTALANGLSISPAPLLAVTNLMPTGADAPTSTMLNSGVFSTGSTLTLDQTVANGSYKVYLWVMENHLPNYRSFNVKVEGVQVDTGIGNLSKGAWKAYGPYAAQVTDGGLTFQLLKVVGEPHLMGISIYQ